MVAGNYTRLSLLNSAPTRVFSAAADALDGGQRAGAHMLGARRVIGERLEAGQGTLVADLARAQDGGAPNVSNAMEAAIRGCQGPSTSAWISWVRDADGG